jgi:hypothetical protein
MISEAKDNLREWLKVSQLRAGMQIAVPKNEASVKHGGVLACEDMLETGEGDIMWDEIEEIKHVGEERVYDIEVEGTHNFVAGHLIDQETNEQLNEEEEKEYLENQNKEENQEEARKVWFGAIFAHNTYITGNTGIGTSTPWAALSVGSPPGSTYPLFAVATTTSDYSTTTSFIIDSDGNVGIGTEAPAGKLEIETAESGSKTHLKIEQTASASGDKFLHLVNTTAIAEGSTWIYAEGDDATDSFIVKGDGTVGIGTASPDEKLEVESSGDTAIHIDGGADAVINIDKAGVNNKASVIYSTAGTGKWYTGLIDANLMSMDGDEFYIGQTTGGTNAAMLIETSGNVGIGDTTPDAQLDVVASSASTIGQIIQGASSQSANLLTFQNSSGTFLSGFTADGGLLMNFASTTALNIQDGSGSQVFVVDSNTGSATSSGYIAVGTPTFGSTSAGDVNISGNYYTNGADYAEYFLSKDKDLVSGEVVCVDITKSNMVERCQRPRDNNVMGIVSSNPGIVGNTGVVAEENELYEAVVVGLLGQVPAQVTDENGAIRPGDSLTPASEAGYLMKADSGDSTVGVALQGLEGADNQGIYNQIEELQDAINNLNISLEQATSTETSTIDQVVELGNQIASLENSIEIATSTVNVLISRRNKSLTVSQIEDKITQRVADMEIEDEVNLLVSGALTELGMEELTEQVVAMEEDLALLLATSTEVSAASVGLSENIPVRELDSGLPEAGDVLVVDPGSGWSAVKSYEENSNQILGVVSNQPISNTEFRPLALTGTARIKVSLENGDINKGDLLTTASKSGYAMRATDNYAGIIGIALEDYFNTQISTSTATSTATSTVETIEEEKQILILLSVRNHIQVNWDEVTVSVIDNPNLGDEVEVEDYEFIGDVVVEDMIVNGRIIVMGEAEFMSEVRFGSNLNLEGAIVREYQEAWGEYLDIGDAVYISGPNQVTKAYSDVSDGNGNFRPSIGLVVEIRQEEGDRFVKVAVGGTVGGFNNLISGSIYYLSSIDQAISDLFEDINIDTPTSTATTTIYSTGNTTATSTPTTTLELIEMTSLTNAPAQEIGNYIQTIGIAESEESLLIMPSLTYTEYTENVELPSVNYSPIYIDNVTIENENTGTEDTNSTSTQSEEEGVEENTENEEEQDTGEVETDTEGEISTGDSGSEDDIIEESNGDNLEPEITTEEAQDDTEIEVISEPQPEEVVEESTPEPVVEE